MRTVLCFFLCASAVSSLMAAEPLKEISPYSSKISIALADSSTGSHLAKGVSEIDFTIRKQPQIAPLIDETIKPNFVISDRQHIKQFFSILWRPTDRTSVWRGPNCSVAVRIATDNKKMAYFHIYLFNGKVPHITPWTGYDSASYINASLPAFFDDVGFDIHKEIEKLLRNSDDLR